MNLQDPDYQFGWNLAKSIFEAGREDAADFARKKSSRKSAAAPGRSYTRGAGKKPAKAPNKSSDLKTSKSCTKGTACGRSCINSNKVCGGQTLKNTVRAAAEYLKRGATTSGKKLSKADQRRIQELSDDAQRQLDERDKAKKPKPEKGGALVPVGGKISQQREAAKGQRKIPERKRTREEALVQLLRMKRSLNRSTQKYNAEYAKFDSFQHAPQSLLRFLEAKSGGFKTEMRRIKRKPPTKAEIAAQQKKVREAKVLEKAIGPDNVAAARDFHHFRIEASYGEVSWSPYPSAQAEAAKLALMQGDAKKAESLYRKELEIEERRRDDYMAQTPMIQERETFARRIEEGQDYVSEEKTVIRPERLMRMSAVLDRRKEVISQALYNLKTGQPLTNNEAELLGIKPTGNDKEDFEAVKRQFRTLARQTHPDLGGDPAAFRDVAERYDYIRNTYDLTGSLPVASERDYEKLGYDHRVQMESDLIDEARAVVDRTGAKTDLSSYSSQSYSHK
jgi:hypothetical protein